MKAICTLLLTVPFACYNICAQKKQTYNQEDFLWDLTEIYSSDAEWLEDYTNVKLEIKNKIFLTKPIETSADLAGTLSEISELRTKTSQVAYYGILRWEEGKIENAYDFLEKGEGIMAEFEAMTAQIESQILAIGKEKLWKWLTDDKAVYRHRHWLNLIIDQSEYRSTPEVESALRKTRSWISSSISTFWEVQGIDKLWPKYVDEKGEEILLNRSAFRSLRKSNNLSYRDAGAKIYYESLDYVADLMGKIYVDKIKAELDLAKLRNIKDGIDANWLLNAGVPLGSYKILLNAARKNKNVLQRYAKIRSKVLKNEQPTFLDFNTIPGAMANHKFSFDESVKISLEASKLISPAFHENMKIALRNKHWMHLADVPKNAAYHIRPPSGKIHPFYILRYQPRLIESRALAGGLFAMASNVFLIGTDGTDVLEAPAHISGDLYSGDILFHQVLAEKIKNKQERAAHLLELLEFIRRFFKNIALIELDAQVQSLVMQKKSISGNEISMLFLDILKDYYGSNKGIIDIPDYLKNDWMTETAVMFMPKYEHHFWAPSMAVGVAMIKSEDSRIRKLFEQSYGDNKYDSYSILKNGGIDLMDEKTYDYLFDYMDEIMDEIEEILK